MAVKTFGTEVLTSSTLSSADTNTYLANSGLVYVTSQTIGTAVASVTVSNCFSATYDDYFVTIDGVSGSAGAAMGFRCVTSGGVDNASNWKGNTFYISTGAIGGLTNANDAASGSAFCGGVDANAASLNFIVQSPYATRRTQLNYGNADDTYWRIGNYYLGNATSYVSMKLIPNAGTLTGGTITVYGYRKA